MVEQRKTKIGEHIINDSLKKKRFNLNLHVTCHSKNANKVVKLILNQRGLNLKTINKIKTVL